ncbi:AraC family transcriptional regulator [Marinomonas mediterranea]|uniref:AraC family transcriptional regulator n=1 Tax=Marinomonas mediterranea TaxID=119864 RepID=UPI00234BF293|nr:AraC family transcriptional regulator [Marinomonas mediterranea]WCN07707.1 helix-turn-helix domain-containing protein [Marinomonas mediterranea]WCN11808.1 helix-turn-helix domain-containing protein [Marinomonas mediterranea]
MKPLRYQHIDELPGLTLSEAKMPQVQFEAHFHLEFHIGLIEQGQLTQSIQGKKLPLTPRTVCIIPPGEVHDGVFNAKNLRVDGKENQYNLATFRVPNQLIQTAFEESELSNKGEQVEGFIRPALIERNNIAENFMQLKRALIPNNNASQLHKDVLWSNSISELLSQLHQAPSLNYDYQGLSNNEFNIIQEYCYANLHRKIGIDELSTLIQLTRFQFIRRFQKRVGIAPHTWLTNLRLESASHKLLSTKTTITDISADVGFYDQSHFNRVFKRAYRVSPSQYRKGT